MNRNKALAAILTATILVCLGSSVHAHKPLLSVSDNQDGTISIEAGFSDGASAAGHKIILKEEKTERVISEHKVGEDGTLELKKPSVPYTVTLDAGEGHVVTKPGPAPSASDNAADAKKSEAEAAPAAPAPVTKAAGPAPTQSAAAQVVGPTAAMAAPRAIAQPALEISPGVIMAFKMMITTQIVMATALIILLAALAYFAGYTVGRKSKAAQHE